MRFPGRIFAAKQQFHLKNPYPYAGGSLSIYIDITAISIHLPTTGAMPPRFASVTEALFKR